MSSSLVVPEAIDLGIVKDKRRKSKVFAIRLSGDPPDSLNIDWEEEPPWGSLIIEPDPQNTFPIRVTVRAEPKEGKDETHSAKILVSSGGETHKIPVSMEVVSESVSPTFLFVAALIIAGSCSCALLLQLIQAAN